MASDGFFASSGDFALAPTSVFPPAAGAVAPPVSAAPTALSVAILIEATAWPAQEQHRLPPPLAQRDHDRGDTIGFRGRRIRPKTIRRSREVPSEEGAVV